MSANLPLTLTHCEAEMCGKLRSDHKHATRYENRWTVLIAFCLFASLPVYSGKKIEKAYAALSEYDYFRAKKLFTALTGGNDGPYANYGLALIYSRGDNPFFNLDSANRRATVAYNGYIQRRKPASFGAFVVDSAAILALAQQVAAQKVKQISVKPEIAELDHYLSDYYLADEKTRLDALRVRDELEFAEVSRENKSRATIQFMTTHPASALFQEALQLRDRQQFEEHTADRKASSYVSFLARFPRNAMVNEAYEQLFAIYRKHSDVRGLSDFVKNYPDAPQSLEAWKLLFSLSVRAYSYAELKKFLEEHPKFPLKTTILKELELNKLVLHPYQGNEFSGYIDNKGKVVIPVIYDEVSVFSEGLAVVQKNDSACFINRENVNTFNRCYSEATIFRNGIAAVKESGRWHFINRLGQNISKQYDEINDLSDGLYVVKSAGRYGALDQFGQVVIEPRFEKLGDFSNGYAYYAENGKYGYVSRGGTTSKAEYEWISDFSANRIALVRQQGRYGLVTSIGKKLLDPVYDMILKLTGEVYLVVQNNLYGFFHSQGCFISQVAYEFQKEMEPGHYTDGILFRLARKGEQALADANGALLVSFGQFDEVGFPKHDLLLVKKKKKYGYADLHFNMKIPYKYTAANDFSDSAAVVAVGNRWMLIDLKGNELFGSPSQIEKVSPGYYHLPDEKKIKKRSGETAFENVSTIQNQGSKPLIITLADGDIKLLD
jgi:hypothetical protein